MATDIRQMHELQVIHCGDELRRTVNDLRAEGNTVGLVPTMGALHAGHLSLVDAARAACDATVPTMFVNPTQVGAGEHPDAYPTDLDAYRAALEERKCDLVFVPSVDQMYPLGHTTTVDVGELGRVLEGVHRPTHFQGVATVVLKLLNLAPADRAYFGRKDYQQTLVV